VSVASAFKEGTGGTFAPDELQFVVLAIIGAVLFVWLAWVVVSSYRAYGANAIDSQELITRAIRATVVMTVLMFLCFS